MPQRYQEFTIEFRFMLSLLRESLGLSALSEFSERVVRDTLDWNEFERLLREHRVLFPVWRKLNGKGAVYRLPIDVSERLNAAHKRQKMRQMQLTSVLLKVARAFDQEGVSYVALKGPALSQWLYGDPVSRHCNDLDVMVNWEDIASAESLLAELGILRDSEPLEERENRGADPRNIAYHRHYSGSGVNLELHWRLSGIDCFFPIGSNRILETSSKVKVAGYPVSVIGEKYVVDYLTLHGSAHCWNRMKWIYEMACFRSLKGGCFESANFSSDSFEGNRQWREQLLIQLFGPDVESSPQCRLSIAARMSLKQLSDPNLSPGSFLNVVRRSFALICVAKGFASRWRYLAQLLSWEPCYRRFPLPESWAFLYVILGPLYWIYLQTTTFRRSVPK